MHVFGLLHIIMSITHVYGKPECTPMKCVTHACANQNAQVQFVQTKMHVYFHAHAGYFECVFRNVSNRVVASRMCSQI